jgi:hypothetical protein
VAPAAGTRARPRVNQQVLKKDYAIHPANYSLGISRLKDVKLFLILLLLV